MVKRNRMRLHFMLLTLLFLNGCLAPTRAVVREFNADGVLVKESETSESVVTCLTRSTAGKTVVAWESGWAAGLAASTATLESPTPQVRIFAGKVDRGMIAALPGQRNWAGIASAIEATKYDLEVTASGLNSRNAGGE